MDLFRTATPEDAEAIARLAAHADAAMTTMPGSDEEIARAIAESVAWLSGDTGANRVLFVLERGGTVAGMSAIIPRLGLERPFYSFRLSRRARRARVRDLSVVYSTLHLTNDYDGYTELATLFLAPEFRGGGAGRLLSLARLAFIADHSERFGSLLMAELRGWLDGDGNSPFWDHLAGRFIDLPFHEADRLSAQDGRFISELIPDAPILLNLLPPAVADSVGRPHDKSAPALRLLKQAGFVWTGLCDVFDGGPSVECAAARTLVAASAVRARAFAAPEKGWVRALAYAGRGADFRATLADAEFDTHCVDSDAAGILGVRAPDEVGIARAARQPDTREARA